MSERYYITGVQIAILEHYTRHFQFVDMMELLKEIEHKQYIGIIEHEKDRIVIARQIVKGEQK